MTLVIVPGSTFFQLHYFEQRQTLMVQMWEGLVQKRVASRICSCLFSKSSIKPRSQWLGLVPWESCPSPVNQTDPYWTQSDMLNRSESGNEDWPLSTSNMLWGIIRSLESWPLLESEDRVVTVQIRFLPTNCSHLAEVNADPFPEMIVCDSLVFAKNGKEL